MADLDVVVVGAGFSGIYAVHAFRSAGLTVRAFEAGDGIGGTWFWNSYPGARCDVESKDYSYSFSPELEQEWSWSERYPAQPEILRYLNHVADKFGLWPYIQLNTRVTAAAWDARRGRVDGDDRTAASVTARFLVSAAGCLSEYQVPALPGLDTFEGPWYHTSRWPAEGVDFTGKRVGLVGTGSTGIQVAPEIAAVAEHLYVFQRTANFAVPNRNRPWEEAEERAFKSRYREYRERGAGVVPRRADHRDRAAGPGRAAGGRAAALHGAVAGRRRDAVPRRLHRRAGVAGGQRRRGRVHAGPDQGDGRRPRRRRAALPARLPGRVEAAVPERRLLRDVQPAERDAGGHQVHADRVGVPGRAEDVGRLLRARRDGVRDRVRRADRGAVRDRHPGR